MGSGEVKKVRIKVLSILTVWLMVIAGFLVVLTVDLGVESSVIVVKPEYKTLYVGGTGVDNYTQIQDAIDEAKYGDTVFVYNGIYYENIYVNKSIELIGEDRENTLINGSSIGDVIRIQALDVTIKGFKIIGDSGIKIVDTDKCKIINNNVSLNRKFGIYFSSSTNINITDNIISMNNGTGLYISNSLDTIINSNSYPFG